MTDSELYRVYARHERDDRGRPYKLRPEEAYVGELPSEEWLYRRYLFLQGVSAGPLQDQLWEAEKAKRHGKPVTT